MKIFTLISLLTLTLFAGNCAQCKIYKEKLAAYKQEHKTEIANKQHYRMVTLKHYKNQVIETCNCIVKDTIHTKD